MPLKSFFYESMGTRWTVTVWDEVSASAFEALERDIISQSQAFDQTYSRLINGANHRNSNAAD